MRRMESSTGLEALVIIVLLFVAYFAACQPKADGDEAEKRDA
jgi:hypothetical protein